MTRGRKLKQEVIAAYGGRCQCCGETLFALLQIDHVHGDGAERRKDGVLGGGFYTWLKENGWPAGFQVLCGACNQGKGRGSECPHQTRQRAIVGYLAGIGLEY